jgi:hypothetical protein
MAPLVMLLWIAVSIVLFRLLRPSLACAVSVIGGIALLPSGFAFDAQGLPPLGRNEMTMIATSIGCLSSHPRLLVRARPGRGLEWLVLLMALGGAGTAFTNTDMLTYGPRNVSALLPSDSLSMAIRDVLTFGLPFVLGRALCRTPRGVNDLFMVLAGAGLIYTLPALFEIRMSPQLHTWTYGYFQSSWLQTARGSGYRPFVFFPHSLALGLFFASAVGAWAVRRRLRRPLMSVPPQAALIVLVGVLILCGNLAALIYGLLMIVMVNLLAPRSVARIVSILAVAILIYPGLRIAGVLPLEPIENAAALYSEDRARSLAFRFQHEDEIVGKAMERPTFGWGGYGRGRVWDQEGRYRSVTDSYWIIRLSNRGLPVMMGGFVLLLWPVWQAARKLGRIRRPRDRMLIVGLASIIVIHGVDLLPNGLFTVLPYFYAGVLSGAVPAFTAVRRRKRPPEPAPSTEAAAETAPTPLRSPATTGPPA